MFELQMLFCAATIGFVCPIYLPPPRGWECPPGVYECFPPPQQQYIVRGPNRMPLERPLPPNYLEDDDLYGPPYTREREDRKYRR
jgi:hypothetical protein